MSEPAPEQQAPAEKAEEESKGCWPFNRKKKPEKGEPETKEPKDRAITQQTLPACKPVLRPAVVLTVFLTVFVIYVPIGAMCVYYGVKAKEVSVRYDDVCMQQFGLGNATTQEQLDFLNKNFNSTQNLTCTVTMTITDEMQGPIYMYYEIHGMYQNFRRYVRSHLDQQLAQSGSWTKYVDQETQSQSCVPLPYNPHNDSQIMNPCGLVAWTNFNDSYNVWVARPDKVEYVPISSQGVAFQSDVEYRFANITAGNIYATFDNGTTDTSNILQFGMNNLHPLDRGGGNITPTFQEDQRFIAWMRLAHMPNFKKLWGILPDGVTLYEGDVVTVNVVNQYNTYLFGGKKYVVLSTTTWLGGHNTFLGWAYVATGIMSLLMAISYYILTLVKPRKLGDVSMLSRKITIGTSL